MILAGAFLVAIVVHVALRASGVWWVLGAAQPLLLVAVAAARRYAPTGAAWVGLVTGLAMDVIGDRIVGPGGIAGALLTVLVATLARSFELAGPLYWIVGALLASTTFELIWRFILATLNAQPSYGWLGALAAVATTSTLALLVASGEKALAWWRSPERRRRQRLQRL